MSQVPFGLTVSSSNELLISHRKEKNMKISKNSFFKIVIISFTLAICLSGCATIEGAGKDIESAGEAVQDAAND